MLEKNITRARRAYVLLSGFPDANPLPHLEDVYTTEMVKDECIDTEPQDMLTDIMHLCDFDFDELLRFARNNYEAERDGLED